MAVKDVQEYIEVHEYWQTELRQIQEMLQETILEETIKWGAPTYTLTIKMLQDLRPLKIILRSGFLTELYFSRTQACL